MKLASTRDTEYYLVSRVKRRSLKFSRTARKLFNYTWPHARHACSLLNIHTHARLLRSRVAVTWRCRHFLFVLDTGYGNEIGMIRRYPQNVILHFIFHSILHAYYYFKDTLHIYNCSNTLTFRCNANLFIIAANRQFFTHSQLACKG